MIEETHFTVFIKILCRIKNGYWSLDLGRQEEYMMLTVLHAICVTGLFVLLSYPNVLNIGKRYVVKKLKSSDKYHPEFCYWICIFCFFQVKVEK